MDNLRGHFPEHGGSDGPLDIESYDDEVGDDAPPAAIGQDERRMQVRAYNFWAGMLGDRKFPTVEDLELDSEGEFGPYSVLLDFTSGIENPAIAFLGEKLAAECGAEGPIVRLNDVPSRSLLSRITDHYLQIIANQAPIGFEAEFINQRDTSILYRGILLPFSSDDDTIDFICGVINWKELADQQMADELLLEIDQALEPAKLAFEDDLSITDWADSPVADPDVLDLKLSDHVPEPVDPLPAPILSTEAADAATPQPVASLLPAVSDEKMGLSDWLASARDFADEAKACENRTRQALYAAVGRAYDFSLAAAEEPTEFALLVQDSGLTLQDRAPMAPVVKLVFGIDYDKTRLAEYAAALDHAHRLGLSRGTLTEHLDATPGGLKAVIAEERRLRRAESGKPDKALRTTPRVGIAKRLRKLVAKSFIDIPADGSEFTLLVARRTPDGELVLLGEAANDVTLIEKAAKQLLG